MPTIKTSIMGAFLGIISGLVWAFSLSCNLKYGIIYGAIAGSLLGLIFSFFQKAATSNKTVQTNEAMFVSSSMMSVIFMFSIALAILVGIIRWLFF